MSIERVASHVGVGSFRASLNYFAGAVSDPQPTSACVFGCLVRTERPPVLPSDQYFWTNTQSDVLGFSFSYSAGGTLRVILADNAGVTLLRLVTAVPPVGVVVPLLFSYDGTTLRTRMNGVADSVASANPGTPKAGNRNTTIGVRANVNNQPAQAFSVLSAFAATAVGADAATLLAVEQAMVANLEQDRALNSGLPVALSRLWDAADIDWIAGTWTDRVAAQVLTMTGALQRYGGAARVLP